MEDVDDDSLKKLEDIINGSSENIPSTKDMLEMLDTVEMDEEVRENLRNMLAGGVPKLFAAGTAIAVVFGLLIFTVILFFGYKLYKSIRDKEKKREEKKKLKQMKKKK